MLSIFLIPTNTHRRNTSQTTNTTHWLTSLPRSIDWAYFPSSAPHHLSFHLPIFYLSPLPPIESFLCRLPHHSPALFPHLMSLFLFHIYSFKLTSADWHATPITFYTQQEALTHRDNQHVWIHNNISFIFRILWKQFMKTLNIVSMCWYKLACEQYIPLVRSVWSHWASRFFTQWWVSKRKHNYRTLWENFTMSVCICAHSTWGLNSNKALIKKINVHAHTATDGITKTNRDYAAYLHVQSL